MKTIATYEVVKTYGFKTYKGKVIVKQGEKIVYELVLDNHKLSPLLAKQDAEIFINEAKDTYRF